MQKHQTHSQGPVLITRPAKSLSTLIILAVMPILVGLFCVGAGLLNYLPVFEAAFICLSFGVPCLSYLWYASKQVTLDENGLTLTRFGQPHRIEASDIMAVTINKIDDKGIPAFYRIRGRRGERFSFTVKKTERDAVFLRIEQFVTTSLASQTRYDMGYSGYFIPIMCSSAFTTLIIIGFIGDAWVLPAVAGICFMTIFCFHFLTHLSLTPAGLTTTFPMPWRPTRHYAWSEIKDLELRQTGDADQAKVLLTLHFTSGRRLRPAPPICGNFFAYVALKTWRDRAAR